MDRSLRSIFKVLSRRTWSKLSLIFSFLRQLKETPFISTSGTLIQTAKPWTSLMVSVLSWNLSSMTLPLAWNLSPSHVKNVLSLIKRKIACQVENIVRLRQLIWARALKTMEEIIKFQAETFSWKIFINTKLLEEHLKSN